MYRGRYKREAVAVKEFLTSAQAEHTGDTQDNQSRSMPTEDEEIIRQEEALFLFRCTFYTSSLKMQQWLVSCNGIHGPNICIESIYISRVWCSPHPFPWVRQGLLSCDWVCDLGTCVRR